MLGRATGALVLLAGTAAMAAPPRFEVPITAVTLSDGVTRYTIPITVDGTPLVAGFDTGSTGLRIMGRALPAAAAARGPSSSQAYSGGVLIEGVLLGKTIVAIGAASGKVPVQRIDKVGCIPQRPQCPGNTLAIEDFGIQGDGLKGEGFPAIIGVAMGGGDAPNPLIALGVTRWIVDLPRPGDATPGRLIVQPSDEEIAGYTRIALIPGLRDRRGGIHDGMAGCLVRTDTQAKTCGAILLDSGAPGIRIALADAQPWPRDTPGLVVIGDGKAQQQLSFVAGRRDQSTGVMVEPPPPNTTPRISIGVMPYRTWSVLYDAKAQAIGLKPRG